MEEKNVKFDGNPQSDIPLFVGLMINEQSDLCNKISKHSEFITKNETFDTLSSEQKNLFVLQLQAMSMYSSILQRRIELALS